MKPIGMQEMGAVFEVTDALEISREKVEVPLLCDGDGSVRRLASGKLEITLPEDGDARAWMAGQHSRIEEVAGDLLGTAEDKP